MEQANPSLRGTVKLNVRATITRALDYSVLLAAILTIPVVVALEQGMNEPWLKPLDWALWAVFAAEYINGLLLAKSRRDFVVGNWLALGVVILSLPFLPDLMGLTRIAGLARLVRLARIAVVIMRFGGEARTALSNAGLVSVAAITLGLVVMGAVLIDFVEPETTGGDFGTGLWWAAITATTVGYGDFAPKSGTGRAVAVILVVAGSGLISVLSATLAAHFVGKQEAGELAEIKQRLAAIESHINQLTAGSIQPSPNASTSSVPRAPTE